MVPAALPALEPCPQTDSVAGEGPFLNSRRSVLLPASCLVKCIVDRPMHAGGTRTMLPGESPGTRTGPESVIHPAPSLRR